MLEAELAARAIRIERALCAHAVPNLGLAVANRTGLTIRVLSATRSTTAHDAGQPRGNPLAVTEFAGTLRIAFALAVWARVTLRSCRIRLVAQKVLAHGRGGSMPQRGRRRSLSSLRFAGASTSERHSHRTEQRRAQDAQLRMDPYGIECAGSMPAGRASSCLFFHQRDRFARRADGRERVSRYSTTLRVSRKACWISAGNTASPPRFGTAS